MRVINYLDTAHVFDVKSLGSDVVVTLTPRESRTGGIDFSCPRPTDGAPGLDVLSILCIMAEAGSFTACGPWSNRVSVKLTELGDALGVSDIRASLAHDLIEQGCVTVAEPCRHEKHGQWQHRCSIDDESELPIDMILDWAFPTHQSVYIYVTDKGLKWFRTLTTQQAIDAVPVRPEKVSN